MKVKAKTQFSKQNNADLGYNVMKGTEYFVSLQASAVTTEEYNVMVNSDKLIDTTPHLTLCKRCRINRRRYNRVWQYLYAITRRSVFIILIIKFTFL
jgi:hypothetical protein